MQTLTRPLIAALVLVGTLAGFASVDSPAASVPTVYEVDQTHSTVGFKVRHLGISTVTGTFADYDAQLRVDPADLSTMAVEATIRVESIDTGNERRDGHLRSEDFFEAETYPEMRFVSTGVTEVDGDAFKLAGDLTMHGVTRPVVLEGEVIGTAVGPGGKPRVGIEAGTTIDRRDFGLTWSRTTEAGGLLVGHDVRIFLEIEAVEVGA